MNNAVVASLAQVVRDLDQVGVRWALIGGFAVSAWAEPRFTRDIDVCVLVGGDDDAEGVALAMQRRGYVVASVVEHEYRDRLATVRLVSPVAGGVLVDLLFASSGLEPEIVESAVPLELTPGLVLPVAQPADLVVLKLLARDDDIRPQDALDLRGLRPALSANDPARILRMAKLAVSRGFHRERDLVGLAQAYLDGP